MDFIVSLRAVVDLFFVNAIKNFNKFIYILNYVLINDVVTNFVYTMWCRKPIGEGVKGRCSYVNEGEVPAFVDGKFLF
jgi:hypothetical protein